MMRDGKPTLLLGLSRENVTRLLDDKPIVVSGQELTEMGLPAAMEVLVIGGETEGTMSAQLGGLNLTPEVAGQKFVLKGSLNDPPGRLSPPVQLTLNEVNAVTASLVGSCDLVAGQSGRNNEAWILLNSLRTLFAEMGYGMDPSEHR